MIIIGIDPGTITGLAVWDLYEQRLRHVDSGRIDTVWRYVSTAWEWRERAEIVAGVVFEDARKRRWLGTKGREALQGAGSIKRDCSIWEDFLVAHKIPFEARAPQAGATKWTAEQFRRLTKWEGRTNEHARDAAMLVYGVRRWSASLHTLTA